jgi:hypothetical protein
VDEVGRQAQADLPQVSTTLARAENLFACLNGLLSS